MRTQLRTTTKATTSSLTTTTCCNKPKDCKPKYLNHKKEARVQYCILMDAYVPIFILARP